MGDESRWSEDDRFGRRDEGPRYGRFRDQDRDFGRFGSSAERSDPYEGQGYGRDYGAPYRGYGHDYGRDTGYRREAGYGGPRSRGQHAVREDRHWWDRASDEVSSWFGDHEAERRREMDAVERGHRGRGPKGYVRSDERIREDVCDRLSDDPIVDASNIDVAVSGSEVTLSGTVESRQERRRAEDCVEQVSGVSHVQNNLRVVAAAGTAPDASGARPSPPTLTRSTGTPGGRSSH